jgi:hypothetical protein
VSIEAAKWASILGELGFDIVTVAGDGPVDVVVGGLSIEDTAAPSPADVRRAIGAADLVVVENICSLPLNMHASTAVADAIAGRPAVLHHHDLPWQRERFAGLRGFPPDDAAWAHVTTSELSRTARRAADARLAAEERARRHRVGGSARCDLLADR